MRWLLAFSVVTALSAANVAQAVSSHSQPQFGTKLSESWNYVKKNSEALSAFYGWSSLRRAIVASDVEKIAVLRHSGIEPHFDEMVLAIMGGDLAVFVELMRGIRPDSSRQTLVYAAARYFALAARERYEGAKLLAQRLGILQELLKNGWDPNARGGVNASTALMAAVCSTDVRAAELLLEHGADKYLLDKRGRNALQCFDSYAGLFVEGEAKRLRKRLAPPRLSAFDCITESLKTFFGKSNAINPENGNAPEH